jgi:hypothetical protein
MATVYRLHEIHLLQEREFFVDANILVYRYYNDQDIVPDWMYRYGAKYDMLVRDGYSLYTSFEVISELINRG